MRRQALTFALLGVSVPVLASLGPGCSSGGTSPAACAPGMQVSCPCAGGGTGVQVCNADGSGYGACDACTSLRDAATDRRVVGDAHAGDGPRGRDGSADVSSGDAGGDGGATCIYPTDGIGSADAGTTLPQPTDGACAGNAAVTCDETSHTLQSNACGASEVCAVYTVLEHPDATLPYAPRTYQWAGCIPTAATPCSFTWSSNGPGTIPSGNWVANTTGVCQGNDALVCTMAPIIPDSTYINEWAGTVTGFVNVTACTASEACADNPMAPGNPACYAAPLVSCSPEANSTCVGDDLYSCEGSPYQGLVDCASQGQKCREDCPIGLPNTSAECRDPLPGSATQCNPATFTSVCADGTSIEDCNPNTFAPGSGADCFMSAGQCVCYPTAHACADIGCADGSWDCQCANVASQGAECIPASSTLCDPSSTPESCLGTVAQECIGYIIGTDCAPLGEICSVADGLAGCIASPATTCTAGTMPSCSAGKLSGCCPATGEFVAGDYSVPCAPGYAVEYACSALNPVLSCTTSGSGAACTASGM